MIHVKTPSEIEKMCRSGAIVKAVLLKMEEMARPGISTSEMDAEAEKMIRQSGATPSFLNYNGFKFATCMSVDDVVVHGFPSKRRLCEGEILSVDVGACLEGWHADAARTFPIGQIDKEKQRLIDVTKQCFFEGLKECCAGRYLGSLSAAIQAHAEKNGYSAVRVMTGHGIGRRLHEDPSVPNYGTANTGIVLKKGFALAIEPMINMGGYEVCDDGQRWTCRTKDGKPSAHYENTVIITDAEPKIITL